MGGTRFISYSGATPMNPNVFQPHIVGYDGGAASCGCPFCKLKQAYQKSVVVFQAAQKKRKATEKKDSRAVRLMLRKHEENGNMEFTQKHTQERTPEEEPMMSDDKREWRAMLTGVDPQQAEAIQSYVTKIKTEIENMKAEIKTKDAALAAKDAALAAEKVSSAADKVALAAEKASSAANKVASAAKDVLYLAKDILAAHQAVDSKICFVAITGNQTLQSYAGTDQTPGI
jgi:hypothetical protein